MSIPILKRFTIIKEIKVTQKVTRKIKKPITMWAMGKQDTGIEPANTLNI